MMSTRVITGAGPAWAAVDDKLASQGIRSHVFARCAWAAHMTEARPLLLVHEQDAEPLAALGVQLFTSRVLPRHSLLRAERVGSTFDLDAHHAFAAALRSLGRNTPGVLRVTAEVVARDGVRLARAGEAWADAGFTRRPSPRTWQRTLVVDLDQSENDILASFSQKPRRDLRSLARFPVEIREIADPALAPRLRALLEITLGRTGGAPQPADWVARMAVARAWPHLARLVGLFRNDGSTKSLVAFAWGVSHGDHATYELGASDRPSDLRITLLTPLLWDLMRWARCVGASWFDLGGISPGTRASGDPLGAISDFKRLFSTTEVEVGADWEFDPRPVRSRLSRSVSRAAAWCRAI
jgi:hypothetical protein